MHIKEHFQTITYHRRLVRQSCFRVGLYWQGLTHDLSKYSLTEFLVGAKYFQGDCSPNNAEKEEKGYSSSWLHHKGRNKHHFEYWIDYSINPGGKLVGMKMPKKYVAEMVIDRISASKNYLKEQYNDGSALAYYLNGRHMIVCRSGKNARKGALRCLLRVQDALAKRRSSSASRKMNTRIICTLTFRLLAKPRSIYF